MAFSIQIYMHPEWQHLILYESDDADRASVYCDRAMINFKVKARVIGPEGEIVYEKFYNQRDDPDYRDWDAEENLEDDVTVDWRKAGF